jgi:hypothetical protein
MRDAFVNCQNLKGSKQLRYSRHPHLSNRNQENGRRYPIYDDPLFSVASIASSFSGVSN